MCRGAALNSFFAGLINVVFCERENIKQSIV